MRTKNRISWTGDKAQRPYMTTDRHSKAAAAAAATAASDAVLRILRQDHHSIISNGSLSHLQSALAGSIRYRRRAAAADFRAIVI